MLIGHQSQIQQSIISSSLLYDNGADERGIIVEVSPSWGYIEANIQDTLWSDNILDSNFENANYSNGTSLSGEFSYGLGILDNNSVLTPFSGIEFSDNNKNQYLLGTRFGLGSNANFELAGRQEQSTTGINSTKVQFEGRLNW